MAFGRLTSALLAALGLLAQQASASAGEAPASSAAAAAASLRGSVGNTTGSTASRPQGAGIDIDIVAAATEGALTGSCFDVGLFTDEKGHHCSDWAGRSCSAKELSWWGYSNAGAAGLRAFCKQTCGSCAAGGPADGGRVDNGMFVDEKGYHCRDWLGWACSNEEFAAWGYSPAGAAAVVAFCPYTCAADSCADSGAFVDEKGYHCTTWEGYTCSVEVFSLWGYSSAGATAVRASCARACGLCPGTLPPTRRDPQGAFLDTFSFVDEHGVRCENWAGRCSAEEFARWRYSAAGQAAVRSSCSSACGLYLASPWPSPSPSPLPVPLPSPSPGAPSICLDDADWKDATGYTCDHWKFWKCTAETFTSSGVSRANANAILDHCTYSCGLCGGNPRPTCFDEGAWRDAKGTSCDSWGFWGCSPENFSSWGYSRAEAEEVLAKCTYSCGLCP